jgi:tryptophan halogenase
LIEEFNRLNNMQYERIRDFLILHYTANDRVGEPLWDYARSMPLPDSLVHKLSLFRSRAALPNYQYGLFARDSWLSVLVGQGVTPQGHDRLADVHALPALQERLAEFPRRIQSNVEAMPTHADFIAEYCRMDEPLSQEAAV